MRDWIIEQVKSMLIALGVFFGLCAWAWFGCWVLDNVL